MNNSDLKKIAEVINRHDNFIISSHMNLDGDALGSELALYFILKQLKKDVKIINQDKAPEIYSFLPGVEEIIIPEQYQGKYPFEIKQDTVLIILDSSNFERIGNINIDMNKIKFIVNIDHHPSNILFGKYNYVNHNASSVGEILYDLGCEMNCNISKKIAISLYTAIITDTGSFRYSNTSTKTFRTTLKLVQKGIDTSLIADYIYNNNKLSTLKLLGEALKNVKTDVTSRISWTFVTRNMLKDTGADDEEVEGIVDKILSIKKVQVSVFFRETKEGYTKISFRSRGKFNVDKFARKFGGGGHPNVAGCNMQDRIEEATHLVIAKLQDELE